MRHSSGTLASLTGNPPCDFHRAPGAFASTATQPNVRDDRDTPLLRAGMAGVLGLIWVSHEADSFFAQDWTGQISLKGLGNFLFWRSGRKIIDPHGEEARSAVSNHVAPLVPFILRDAASRLLRMRSGRSFWREDEGLFIDMNRTATAIGKKRNIAASETFAWSPCKQERPMLKTLITVSTVLLATAAFAQTSTKSPGSSEYAPGQKMQKSTTSTAPGASEYAPGHKKKTAKGHSGSAPGHQTTTGMATKKKY